MTTTISFKYLNHRGKLAERIVDVDSLEFIREPGFGYQSGWFISGQDHEKDARRSFSLDRIIMDEENVPRIFKLLNLDTKELPHG